MSCSRTSDQHLFSIISLALLSCVCPSLTETRWLGYSIETYCTKMKYYPADQREHRGLAYGKRKMYFDPTNGEYRWAGVLGPAIVAQAPGIDPKNGRQV